MGEHLKALASRLGYDPDVVELTQIFIPPYRRWREGQMIESVDGYWRELGPGGVDNLTPDELEAVARSGREYPAIRGTFAKPTSARVQSASMNPPPLERSHRADDPSERAFDIGTDVPGDPAATAQRRKLRNLTWTSGPARGWETAEDDDFVYSKPYGSTDVRRIAALPKARSESGGLLPTSGGKKHVVPIPQARSAEDAMRFAEHMLNQAAEIEGSKRRFKATGIKKQYKSVAAGIAHGLGRYDVEVEEVPPTSGTSTTAERKGRDLFDKYEAAVEANMQARVDIESQYQKALYAPAGKRAAYDRKVAAAGKAFTRLVDHLEATTPPPAGHQTWMDVKPTEIREHFRGSGQT